MVNAFLYLALFAISIWTSRMAVSKGRSPWAWGGAALLLSTLPYNFWGIIPILLLMIMKSPATDLASDADRLSCPRCAKTYSTGQHFCIGCGWDLGLAYSPEDPDGVQAEAREPQTQTQMASTAVAEPVEASPAPAPVASEAAAEAADESDPAVDDSVEPKEETEEEYVPWGTYDIGSPPTAAVMTERGMERFAENKFQEAIDQFTKAIALDPNYAEAWQRRAEAYAQMGRSDQADEDRRHLQGLDPSSSPG